MQAILTKYIPATNNRCSRIKATCERGAITISFPHEFDIEGAHAEAARVLVARFIKEDVTKYSTPADKNPWGRKFSTGGLPNGNYAHVFNT